MHHLLGNNLIGRVAVGLSIAVALWHNYGRVAFLAAIGGQAFQPGSHGFQTSAPCAATAQLKVARAKRRRCRVAPRKAGEEEENVAPAVHNVDMDWRDFRAKLVQQSHSEGFWQDALGIARPAKTAEAEHAPSEKEVKAVASVEAWLEQLEQRTAVRSSLSRKASPSPSPEAKKGWLHSTPVLESGSLLLANPSDSFAIGGPYFHKAVILILDHSPEEGSMGVMLNRPTAESLELYSGDEDYKDWNVWFGGPVDTYAFHCLHTRDDLAFASKRIFRGLYAISPNEARVLVKDHLAEKSDFLVLMGHCGWAQQQLEFELEAENWVLAAADTTALMDSFHRHTKALFKGKQHDDTEGVSSYSSTGISMWRRLFRRLGQDEASRLEDADHADRILELWTQRWLGMGTGRGLWHPRRDAAMRVASLPSEAFIPSISDIKLSSSNSHMMPQSMLKSFWPKGSILLASATSFLLDIPEDENDLEEALCGQALHYLHKGVLALVEPADEQSSHVMAVLLNGPQIQFLDQESTSSNFGGDYHTEVQVTAFGQTFRGHIILDENVLGNLLGRGALQRVTSVTVDDLLALPRESRWEAAGGEVEDEELASLGDEQRRLWYADMSRQFEAFGMNVEFEEPY